ncbi:hypothetical protein [Rhizobium tubonense]|uniref:Uncharacterized protein n=1 Tax=Rhizobium tubonense TaxID=484088 RepID=A0A2W4DTY9_9HYPH|nr:hypothetical protein [Rhizobium tubonense]PZM07606.1 hypothetical protein CPY51_31245 [Rhizobium tubonense]
MLTQLIEAYFEAQRIWEARFDADCQTAGHSPEWDAYEEAEDKILYYPCETMEDVRTKAQFLLGDDSAFDSLRTCARVVDGEHVFTLTFFLQSMLTGSSVDKYVESGESR